MFYFSFTLRQKYSPNLSCVGQYSVLGRLKWSIIRTSKYFNKICNCSIQLYRLMWRSDYIVGFLSLNHSFQQNIWLQSDIIFTCTWLITGIQGTHRNQVGRKLTSSTPTPFKCLTWCKQNWGPVRALRFISTGPSKNCLLITDRDSRYFKHAIIF